MMTNDIYAVVDLGSTATTAMVGYRDKEGYLCPIAYTIEPSASSIRHGHVQNVDEAATMLKRMLEQLNSNLEDNFKIDAVYVGFGGQSLASQEHIIRRVFEDDAHIITKDEIEDLWREARGVTLENREVLEVSAPLFWVNGLAEKHPQGIPARQIEARFQLITARPIRSRNIQAMADRAGVRLAGIIVTPIAEASVVLTDDERMLGACYVDLGGGCTSLSIYKDNLLRMVQVIPMGGINVTTDLMSARLVEGEAELIKIQRASMQTDINKDKKIRLSTTDRQVEREFSLRTINRLTVARVREIYLNIVNIIRLSGFGDKLGAGIVIGGGGSLLTGFLDMLYKELEEVHPAQIRRDLVRWAEEEEEIPPQLTAVFGMLNLSKENCVRQINIWSEAESGSLEKDKETVPHQTGQVTDNKPVYAAVNDPIAAPTGTILIEEEDEEEEDKPLSRTKTTKEKKKRAPQEKSKKLGDFLGRVMSLFNGEDEDDE